MASKDSVIMALGMLQTLSPSWELTDMVEKVWILALRNLSDEEVENAVGRYITSHTSAYGNRQPVPGDIIAAAQVDSGLGWEEAFNEIMQNAHKMLYPEVQNGQVLSVVWSSPELPKLMDRMGGGSYFWSLEEGQMGTARAQFGKMYQAEERRLGGAIKRDPIAIKPGLTGPDDGDLHSFALAEADRLLSRYKSTLTEAEYNAHHDAAVQKILRNERKAAKVIQIDQAPSLTQIESPEAKAEREAAEQRRAAKAAEILEFITGKYDNPEQALGAVARSFSQRGWVNQKEQA